MKTLPIQSYLVGHTTCNFLSEFQVKGGTYFSAGGLSTPRTPDLQLLKDTTFLILMKEMPFVMTQTCYFNFHLTNKTQVGLPHLYVVAREDANLSSRLSFIPVLVYLSTDEYNISLVEGKFSV